MQQALAMALIGSVLFAVARYFLKENLGEAISMGLFLFIALAVIVWRLSISRLAEYRRIVAPSLRPWLSLIVIFAVVGPGTLRYGSSIFEMALDAVFGFIFFTAMNSIFSRRPR